MRTPIALSAVLGALAMAVVCTHAASTGLPEHLRGIYHRHDLASLSVRADSCVNVTVQIPTPDGVLLNTYVFIPPAAFANTTRVPVVMERTPYGAIGLASAAPGWCARGYAVVAQDFRGRFGSTGSFDFWRSGGADAATTIAWIIQQPWSNGLVGTMGASADGIAQYVQLYNNTAALASQFVVVASAQIHETTYTNGAYQLDLITGWLTAIGEQDYPPVVIAQEQYSSWWAPIDMTQHFGNAHTPAVHVSGWYDIFNRQNMEAYAAYRTQAQPQVRDLQYMIVTPGGHCGGGQITWTNSSWGLDLATAMANQMMDATLKPNPALQGSLAPSSQPVFPGTTVNVPKMVWYVLGPGEVGSVGNYWTGADNLPTATPSRYYLNDKGRLTSTVPGLAAPSAYVYDPSVPVPTEGGNNLLLKTCGPYDQSKVDKREDVIRFESETLVSSVAITGIMNATLFVSTNATDTDFVVKLTDIFPDGRAMLVQDSIVRMKWRNGPDAPQLLTPNTIYNVTIEIGYMSYVFNPLHKIGLSVTSSNFPRFSANPNNGLPLSQGGANLLGIQGLYHDTVHASYIELPVVPLSALPRL